MYGLSAWLHVLEPTGPGVGPDRILESELQFIIPHGVLAATGVCRRRRAPAQGLAPRLQPSIICSKMYSLAPIKAFPSQCGMHLVSCGVLL